MNSEEWVKGLLERSEIRVNGNNPWDIKILNQNTYNRIKAEGSLGLGEAYMDGWWDCASLDDFFFRIARSDTYNTVPKNLSSLYFCKCFCHPQH